MNDHSLNALMLFLQLHSPELLKSLREELKDKQAALGGGASPVGFMGFGDNEEDDEDDVGGEDLMQEQDDGSGSL